MRDSCSHDAKLTPEAIRSLTAPYVQRAPLPMVEVVGPDHIVGHVNRAFCRILGKEREEVVGKPFAAIVSGGDVCLPFLDQVYRTGEYANCTHAEDLDSGRTQWLYAMWPVLGEEDQPVAVIIQLARTSPRDDMQAVNESLLIAGLQQHRLAEEALAVNEHLRREIELRSMLGRRAQLLLELGAQLLHAPPTAEWIAQAMAGCASELGVDAYSCYLTRPDGTIILERDSGLQAAQREALQNLLFGDGVDLMGDHSGLVMGARDPESHKWDQLTDLGVTALAACPLNAGGNLYGVVSYLSKSAEAFDANDLNFVQTMGTLLAAGMDRQRLFEDLNSAREAAEHANAAKDDFLAALSHELRIPLNPVLLLATEAAANPAIAPALRADFEMIGRNVLLEARLIDDLLDSTRIAHGKLTLQQRAVPLHEVLRDAIGQVETDLDVKGLTIRVEGGDDGPWIDADPMRLQQVFWNLLKNAVKFTPSGGSITVLTTVDPDGQRLKVDISDTGIGLSTEELSRIFEAFAQGDHSAQGRYHGYGGLGLGLAIAKRLVEMHNGGITASSPGQGAGTRFTVDLPTIPAPAQPASPPDSVEGGTEQAVGANAMPRILLVEDHEATRFVLQRLLTMRKFDVTVAGTLAEALDLGTHQSFDLLVTDVGLPDGSGYELMKELGHSYGMKGIALTGYGMDADLEHSRDAGFFRHLTKPIGIQDLEAAVRAALESKTDDV